MFLHLDTANLSSMVRKAISQPGRGRPHGNRAQSIRNTGLCVYMRVRLHCFMLVKG